MERREKEKKAIRMAEEEYKQLASLNKEVSYYVKQYKHMQMCSLRKEVSDVHNSRSISNMRRAGKGVREAERVQSSPCRNSKRPNWSFFGCWG